MSWEKSINEFKSFLKIERSLSENSVSAYLSDINKLRLHAEHLGKSDIQVTKNDIVDFINVMCNEGLKPRTQSRVISAIKSFYKFLILEDYINLNPTDLIEVPAQGFKLPQILSIEEIDLLLNSIDLSKPNGHRNRAMLEVLYSCGLRVSELINLKISNINKLDGYIRIIGKGNVERLTPIGITALKFLYFYIDQVRFKQKINKEFIDFVFLNNRGSRLSRVMIFHLIRKLSDQVNINKQVSPHTFRHSFATHLIERGANLRAVQEMLGHKNITTTEIYTHLDKDYLRSNIIKYHPRS